MILVGEGSVRGRTRVTEAGPRKGRSQGKLGGSVVKRVNLVHDV